MTARARRRIPNDYVLVYDCKVIASPWSHENIGTFDDLHRLQEDLARLVSGDMEDWTGRSVRSLLDRIDQLGHRVLWDTFPERLLSIRFPDWDNTPFDNREIP